MREEAGDSITTLKIKDLEKAIIPGRRIGEILRGVRRLKRNTALSQCQSVTLIGIFYWFRDGVRGQGGDFKISPDALPRYGRRHPSKNPTVAVTIPDPPAMARDNPCQLKRRGRVVNRYRAFPASL